MARSNGCLASLQLDVGGGDDIAPARDFLAHIAGGGGGGAADRFGGRIDLLDLRTVMPWDRGQVLESVSRTGRCFIVHEDTLTAGFGAEIAATVARDAFWVLDAPVERLAVDDVPMPYHPTLMDAVLPDAARIAAHIDALLSM